ncbi:hypothetical protein INR49_016242 [Caranx melampygus]|nr:hypothetical protein INR49_016242 [Caranx melampygus]
MGLEPEPERTSLQGFCPAHDAATNPPVKPSHVEQVVTPMTPVQLGQVAAPQTMVQRIEMKDTQVLSSSHLRYILFLASKQSAFTLDPCGETQCGNLQVDWMALTCVNLSLAN